MSNSRSHIKSSRWAAVVAGLALGAVCSVASAGIISVDVSGAVSNGERGDPFNTTITIDLAAQLGAASGTQVDVDGLGWDVTIEAFTPSWLSEARAGFIDSGGTILLNLVPGAGDDSDGVGTYSSGGIVDLIGLGLDFSLADGILVLEFYEEFDDGLSPDAIWQSGTLSIQAFAIGGDVPAPATVALLGLGLLGVAYRRRRH